MDINFKKLKTLDTGSLFRAHLGAVLWILLLLLLIVEGVIVKGSVKSLFSTKAELPPALKQTGVRINFDSYHAVVNRIQQGKTYTAPTFSMPDPFTVPVQPIHQAQQ